MSNCDEEEMWVYEPEWITPSQVEALRKLLAIPCEGSMPFEYIMDEEHE